VASEAMTHTSDRRKARPAGGVFGVHELPVGRVRVGQTADPHAGVLQPRDDVEHSRVFAPDPSQVDALRLFRGVGAPAQSGQPVVVLPASDLASFVRVDERSPEAGRLGRVDHGPVGNPRLLGRLAPVPTDLDDDIAEIETDDAHQPGSP